MKKSNKLLVGGFLAGLLLITSIHVSLYAKYKAGDYTFYNPDDDIASSSMQVFPNILFVSVRSVYDVTVKFDSTAQVQRSEDDDLDYVQHGDTLLITSKNRDNQHGNRHHVVVSLPAAVTMSVFNSSLSFETGRKITSAAPKLYLQKSQATFFGSTNAVPYEQLTINASDNSVLNFRENTTVTNLQLQLSNSSIDDDRGSFNQLSIVTDSASRVSLQAKHLLKATIKTIPSQ